MDHFPISLFRLMDFLLRLRIGEYLAPVPIAAERRHFLARHFSAGYFGPYEPESRSDGININRLDSLDVTIDQSKLH
jgi:hypothetical protein